MQGDQSWKDGYLQIGDEFALQTIPQRDENGKMCVGFVTAASVDDSIFCDFLDGEHLFECCLKVDRLTHTG